MRNNYITILDLQIDKKLININEIAKRAGLNQSHISLILSGVRQNNYILEKLRDAIVKYYSNAFSYPQVTTNSTKFLYKNNSDKPKTNNNKTTPKVKETA